MTFYCFARLLILLFMFTNCFSSTKMLINVFSYITISLLSWLLISCWIIIVALVDRFNEFGIDGGPAAKTFAPKFKVFSRHVSSHTGFQVPPVEVSDAFFFCSSICFLIGFLNIITIIVVIHR